MPKAPSIEGAFLVSETPPSGRHRGWVLVTVGVWLAGGLFLFRWAQETANEEEQPTEKGGFEGFMDTMRKIAELEALNRKLNY